MAGLSGRMDVDDHGGSSATDVGAFHGDATIERLAMIGVTLTL